MSEKEPQNMVSRNLEAYPSYYQEPEISLIDLWLVLVKRKKIILFTTVGMLLLGLVYVLLTPKKYLFHTAVEIGTTLVRAGDGLATRLIDTPDTVIAKLQESYIPATQHELAQRKGGDHWVPDVEARIAKKSQIVILEARGPAVREKDYLTALNSVLGKLKADHQRQIRVVRAQLSTELSLAKVEQASVEDPATLETKLSALDTELTQSRIRLDELRDERILAVPRQKLEAALERSKNKLLNLKDNARLLQNKYKRLDEIDKLLKKQISDFEKQNNETILQRSKAAGNVTDAPSAMTLMMIDNEIQKNKTRLADLEERLFIDQMNAREALEKEQEDNRRTQDVQAKVVETARDELAKLSLDNKRAQERLLPQITEITKRIKKVKADHARDIAIQEQKTKEIETRLQNMKETRALIKPVRSLKPVSPSGKLILLVALILGLVLGILGVFVLEFLNKVREKRASLEQKNA